MNLKRTNLNKGNYILALHSSSETLGVAVRDLRKSSPNITISTFDIGRKLSNNLFSCIDKILPKKYWSEIARLAVATGPGGFTGTRITVALTRTIAQQLGCSLDGISSFALIAKRLSKENLFINDKEPFWIQSLLKRRGYIVGQYQIVNKEENASANNILELTPPHLVSKTIHMSPAFDATEDVSQDVIELLNISSYFHKTEKQSCWKNVVPIYPTSPVDND